MRDSRSNAHIPRLAIWRISSLESDLFLENTCLVWIIPTCKGSQDFLSDWQQQQPSACLRALTPHPALSQPSSFLRHDLNILLRIRE